MRSYCKRIWIEDDGVLAFEWVLLCTLLTIGVVGGIAAVRDAIVDELGDVAQAMSNLDQSYLIIDPPRITLHGSAHSGGANSSFVDSQDYFDCDREPIERQQAPVDDGAGS